MTSTELLIAGLAWFLSVGLTYVIADRRDAEDKWLWLVIGMGWGPLGVLFALVKARPAPTN